MSDRPTVPIDSLLAELDSQISQAIREIDVSALLALVDLQGQKRGMLRLVQYSREQVAQQQQQPRASANGVDELPHLGPPLTLPE